MDSPRSASGAGAGRNREHNRLVSVLCALAVLALFFITIRAGAPFPVVGMGLVAACLAACGWVLLVALRARRNVESTLRRAMEKRDVLR